MNFILSGAWLYKRKKEPETMKEEDVINIVQQALDNPSANTTVDSHPSECSSTLENRRKNISNAIERPSAGLSIGFETSDKDVDPAVVAFFKDFPEPYRQKAIQRFSDRSGWHKFDAVRDFLMEQERSVALNRGIFMEDARERKEKEADLKKKWLEEQMEELAKENQDRVVPEWEKFVVQYIPLADDESLGWKLFNTANLAALSGFMLYQGIKGRHGLRSEERWKVYVRTALRLGFSGLFGVGTVYRAMDWGVFDRSVDKRDFLTRVMDDTKEDVNSVIDFVERKSK